MTNWSPGILERIGETDDFRIAPLRADGVTHGTPTWIWSVVVDGRLFVRPYSGPESRWYQSAMTQGAGQISAAGHTYDVTFEPADPELNDRVDDAYRAKYAGNVYLRSMIAERQRSVTVEVTPRAGTAGD